MLKNGHRGGRRQGYRCPIKKRERMHVYYEVRGRDRKREKYEESKANGMCTRCRQQPLLSEALCWDCLNDMEVNDAVRI